MTAGGADSLSRNQHARTNDYSFVNRIAQGNIDKLAAAHESASEIAHGSETCFDSSARVRRGNDRLLGDVEIELSQSAHIVIAGVIQSQMCMCVHESRRERRIAQIDHLRVGWNSQIATNIDNLIVSNDDDAIWNE